MRAIDSFFTNTVPHFSPQFLFNHITEGAKSDSEKEMVKPYSYVKRAMPYFSRYVGPDSPLARFSFTMLRTSNTILDIDCRRQVYHSKVSEEIDLYVSILVNLY